MSDFNPGFSFSFGSEPAPAQKQAAWEFGGALRQAKAEQSQGKNAHATSVDQKISRRRAQNADIKEWKAEDKRKSREQQKAQKSPQQNGASHEPAEEEADHDADEEDSDEPLPGEVDDDDSEGEVIEEESEEDEEGGTANGGMAESSSEDEEQGGSDGEEEDPRAKAREQQQQQRKQQQQQQMQQRLAMAGSKRRKEEEEGGSKGRGDGGETDEELAGAGGKQAKKSKQQQQQQQQQPSSKAEVQQQRQQEQQQKQGQGRGGTPEENGSAAARQQPGASTSGKSGKEGFFARTPDGTTFTATSFGDLQLSRPLLKAISGLGYSTPTPIQAAVIPLALAGRDVCGSAITGSGKTAAYTLPCLERLLHRPRQIAATYVLVLAPTRELAVQVHSMITTLAQHTDISAALVVGGLSSQVQASVLRRSPEIVVATPGRLIDHLHNTQSVGLEDLAVLILDEADRLLEMGFKEEVTEILRAAPKKRQTMLFSATFNDEVRALMALSLKQPVRLAADAALAVPKELRQEVVRLKGAAAAHKEAVLLAMCARSFRGAPAIIFFRTKQRAHRLKILFGLLGLPPAAELHGDMTQAARLESLEMFRTKEACFLLATDVAARGLDISGVEVVINYDTPRTLETYLHRIGRTARAGAAGVAVTFVEDSDRRLLKEVVRKTKANVCQRLVPAAAVTQWQSKLEAAEQDVDQVIQEERYERELRKAEMEANKTQNMIDHADEIHARPARSWFMSEKQKKEVARKANRAAAGLPPLPGDNEEEEEEEAKPAAPTKQEKKNEKKARMKQEAAEKKAKEKKDALMEETGDQTKQIRSAKAKMRALREQGMTAAAAAKAAAAAAAPKKKKKSAGGGKAEEGLFSGDGTGRKAPAAKASMKAGEDAGKDAGPHSNKRSDRTGFSKAQLSRIKRGGVGKKSFKSKKKYQRKKK